MRVTRLEVVFLSFFKNHIKYHFFKRIFLGPIYIPISKPGHNILGHQNMRYRLASGTRGESYEDTNPSLNQSTCLP